MTENLLITGSAGFIGRNFTNLYGKDINLFHVDELHSDSADPEFWATIPDDEKFTGNVDEISVELLEKWKITNVIHAAARSHVDDSISNPVAFTVDNSYSTHQFLEVCRKYGRLNKFVLVSTDEVLGSLGPNDHPFREDDQYKPNSPYSASKAAQEMIARAYHETYKMPIVITRCSNNYGKWQHQSKLIPKILKCLLGRQKIPVYGNGLNSRDWISVEHHCYGLLLALSKGKPGEIYHFGSDNEKTNLEIVKILTGFFGKTVEESVEFVSDRLGHDLRYAMNSQKAKKELGWTSDDKYFTSNLWEVYKWSRENINWLNRS